MRINQCFLQQQGLTHSCACHRCQRRLREEHLSRVPRTLDTPCKPRGCNLFNADGHLLSCAASLSVTEPHHVVPPVRSAVHKCFQSFYTGYCAPTACWKVFNKTLDQPPIMPRIVSDNTIRSSCTEVARASHLVGLNALNSTCRQREVTLV
jgi:hypothetical protein